MTRRAVAGPPVVGQGTHISASGQPDRSRRPARLVLAGTLTGVVAGVVLALVAPAWLVVLTALAALVLCPTSPRLDRRLALNLSLVLGFSPFLVWLGPILGSRAAAASALAVGLGATLGAGMRQPSRVVPRTRSHDAALVLAATLAGLVVLPLRSPGSAENALAMMSTGIDNAAHFSMFLEQRFASVHSQLISANADGTGFAYAGYPQSFHRTLTLLAQLAFGDPGDSRTELVRFAQLHWVAFVALAVLVSAAVLQAIPASVPAPLALAATGFVLSLVIAVPGVPSLLYGHLSFVLAACAPLVLLLLTWRRERIRATEWAALVGLVLVSAAWTPLVPLSVAAAVPTGRRWWRSAGRGPRVLAASLTAVAVVGGATAVVGGLGEDVLTSLLRDGAVPRVFLPVMLVLLVGSAALVTRLWRGYPNAGLAGHVLVAGAACAEVSVLGGYMVATTGSLTYYFWKLGLAALVVALSSATHAAVVTTRPRMTGGSARRAPILTVFLLMAGMVGLGSALDEYAAPSLVWALKAPSILESRVGSPEAGDVYLPLALAETTDQREAAHTRLLATREQDMDPASASAWFHVLSHSATPKTMSADDGVYRLAHNREDVPLAVALARQTLASPGSTVVVTDERLLHAIREAVPSEEAARVRLVS